ncbi:MAG: hypothetical protein HZA77_04160 [Candidatus Schekmanbacteria bacterium]|nr:hypothetical protein [Candidatus Schekmanbacteria bacterium]
MKRKKLWKVFFTLTISFVILLTLINVLSAQELAVTNWTIVGWNNLGMHCMDSDFSVFSILPPYNVINAQLIDSSGKLVTSDTGITVTYEAVADPDGSINKTSVGKTNFWDYVLPLFGVSLSADVGLPVPGPASYSMPGTGNTPQSMAFESSENWFAAYGIPITPYDDAMNKNAYPMMRITAKQGSTTLATSDIVLPVSDEMDCSACHSSLSGPDAQPAAGWVNDPDPTRDYRLNILRLHDERQAANTDFQNALTTKGYNASGLYATVVTDSIPILCAACHKSEALPGSGITGINPLTEDVHYFHAHVIDPTNSISLNSSDDRSACYRCHPGSTTRCLRGAMGKAVASDGSMLMQCQNCHGSMSDVGASTRTGWLNEPNCQNCHTGTAVQNNGEIRYTSVFDTPGNMRDAVNQTFATNQDTPATGLSLYRYSSGHGGLKCEACHGSTHAEFPSSHNNDNIASTQHQGHVGMLIECDSCHATVPNTVSGGPHGMHPVGKSWVNSHPDKVEGSGAAQCRDCHGLDYRGTVLSRSQADRSINAFNKTNLFWRGFQIGCYTCHKGPGSENANSNRAPVVSDVTTSTSGVPLAIPLNATDKDGDSLTLRIVSQAGHGSVGLSGTAATYYPEDGYTGGDFFTFAANDGQTDSNLGTVSINVASDGGCTYSIDPASISLSALSSSGNVKVTAGNGCAWTAISNDSWITITSGSSGTGNGTVKYTVDTNSSNNGRSGTMTIAGYTFTITQAGTQVDATGEWKKLKQTRISIKPARYRLNGIFIVKNESNITIPKTGLAIYLSSDATVDEGVDKLLKTYKIKSLKAGKSMNQSIKINLPKGVNASGMYVIGVVDADDKLPDADDTNNVIPYGPMP